jgi:lysophospholipase L1-like esterase
MRPLVNAPGAALGARRPAATVVGLSAVPALGSLCGALLVTQARRAHRALRPYTQAIPADGTIGLLGQRPVHVVWLGDSLAAGLGVDAVDDTPARTVARMLERAVELRVLAVPGATSTDVLQQQVPALGEGVDLIVLCVGANDVARLKSRRAFARNLGAIVAATAPIPTIVLSLPAMAMADRIPEPLRSLCGARARWFERARVRALRAYPHAMSVDIASRPAHISRRAGRAMLSADRFHPGADVYRIWAERIADAGHRVLSTPTVAVPS